MQFNPISPQWRTNTSTDKVTELAFALQSLRFIIGEIDPSKAIIGFNTQAQSYTRGSPTGTNEHSIMIDPTPAIQSEIFPIPSTQFDILVGYAIHEACHTQASSHDLLIATPESRTILTRQFSSIIASSQKLSQEFLNQLTGYYEKIRVIGEEIYVDNLANRLNGMYYQYIHRARMNDRPDQVDDEVWVDPFRAWRLTGFYGLQPPDSCPMFIQKCLALFADTQSFLIAGDHSVNERREAYITTAIKYHYLQVSNPPALPRPQPPINNPPMEDIKDEAINANEEKDSEDNNAGEGGQMDTKGEENDKDDDNETDIDDNTSAVTPQPDTSPDMDTNSDIHDLELPMHPGGELTPELIALVEEAITQEREDLTVIIQEALDTSKVMDNNNPARQAALNNDLTKPTIWEISSEPEDNNFDPQMVIQLRWIENLKNKIAKQPYRGQDRGKLDPSRMYRGATDRRVFQKSKIRPQQELELVLLVDASASMRGEGDAIYPHVNALHKAIPSSVVISYTTHNNYNKIVQVASSKGIFHEIDICGGTPSGHALIATAHKYPKALIIHFTDGECNSGLSTRLALEVMAKQYPDAYVVNIEYPDRKTLGTFDNAVVKELTTLEDFPRALMEALGSWQPGLKSVLGVK